MKKISLLLLLALNTVLLFSEDIDKSYLKWELTVFVGSFDNTSNINVSVTQQQTDTAQVFPVMFKLPDKIDSTQLIDVYDYTRLYGDIPYFENYINSDGLMQKAVKHYFKSTYRRDIIDKINIIPNSDNPISGNWIIDDTIPSEIWSNFSYQIIDKFGYEYWNSINDNTLNKAVMLMVPIYDYSAPHGFVGTTIEVPSSKYIGIQYRPEVLNETNAVICHEIGHLIFHYPDAGDPYTDTIDGEPIGQNFSAAWPYDLMSPKGGGYCSQYQLYGIPPFSTNDIWNTVPRLLPTKYIVPNDYSNATKVRLKSIREPLLPTDSCNVVIIPIENIDFAESFYSPTAKYVENQRFIIEYRNGKGYENCSPVDMDGECKGIFIQHIINDKSFYRIIDVECATALPDSARNSEDIPDSLAEYRGKWFFGKEINDWMDDIVFNNKDSLNGGNSAWWRAPTASKAQSLPSDFFNDTDRNKFTPSTRPNTNSWKNAETNIGIFIDKIDEENDSADLRIYRNYFSTPLTSANAKTLPDGEKGLDILGDGYIGENFYVDENMFLYLGGGVNPEPKTTLVPGTDMHVRNNGVMQLKDYSKMRLENSSLTFDSGSIFNPTVYAEIELDGSNIFCESGFSISTIGTFNGFNISVSGVSSFYNSNFDMIGASLLTLEESSQFTVIAGSNIILSSQSVLTLKAGSELVIEPGANVVFEPGAKLVVEGNAKITGTIKIPASATAILQSGSILTIGTRSSLVLDDGAKIEAYENAEIFIERGGSIITDNNITIGLIEMDYMPVSGTWKGITCDAETTVTLRNTRINGAVIGLSGMPENLLLTENCSFVDCETAVSIENCNNYEISYSNFNGSLKGQGIVLTQSTGNIFRNYIYEFDKGITLINSSPYIFNNQIYGNITYGLYATGFASIPQLIPLYTSYPPYNNNIWNNGVGNENGAQVCLDVQGKIYLDNGINNIYSEPLNVTPAVPCIKTLPEVVQATRKGDVPNPVFRYEIPALMNYWGSTSVNGNYFELNSSYTIAYLPYSTVKYPTLNPSPHPNPPQTGTKEEVIMLAGAIEDEFYGKYADAKVKYDTLISEYAKTNEAMVAYAKLPNVYSKLGLDLSVLNSAYDNVLSSNVKNLDVNFFKELKVSAYLKNKLYDDAIALAQEMLQAATSENEAIISQKDIDIANRLKGITGKSSGVTGEYDNPSSISESVLPKEHSLFQNYPNPFNPITSINFALSKTSEVKLSVYNISGQIVAELVNGTKQAGLHTVDFDGSKLNSGVYYYTLEADGLSITKKMVLTK